MGQTVDSAGPRRMSGRVVPCRSIPDSVTIGCGSGLKRADLGNWITAAAPANCAEFGLMNRWPMADLGGEVGVC